MIPLTTAALQETTRIDNFEVLWRVVQNRHLNVSAGHFYTDLFYNYF